jgi:hypothetical protein
MTEQLFPKIRASDFRFTKIAEEDDPDLYCSRCHQLIDDTSMVGLNISNSEEVYGEWRFHPSCVGMENWFESTGDE